MENQVLIEKIIKEVMASMGTPSAASKPTSTSGRSGSTAGKNDYPLATKRPELVRTPTNKTLGDITLSAVLSGEITASDVRIAPHTLELQAQIAESVGRDAFARNLRRAAELIAVPDERVLEIYNAMRPYRSTKQELYAIADELEGKYSAKVNAAFVREAADVYEIRKRLKKD